MNNTSVLTFQNTEFDVVDIHNVAWLRLPQVGVALDYKNPYHLQKIYDRNSDEFTEEMTRIVELNTAGGRQQVRIFSLRGCHLIGMLSRTEKAKEFRKWVLDILEGRQMPRQIGHITVPQILSVQNQVSALLKELKRESNPAIRRTLHAQLDQACRLLSIPTPALAEIGHAALPDHESPLIEEFWEIFALLASSASNKLNHSRNKSLLAINMPQVRA